MVSKSKVITVALCAIFASSCGIENVPRPVDTGPYVGCYTDGTLRLALDKTELSMNGKRFPYIIEFKKVGYVINSKFIVDRRMGKIQITPTQDERYYRIFRDDGMLSIVVADGDAQLYILKRQNTC